MALRTYLTADTAGWNAGFKNAGKQVRTLRRKVSHMQRRFGRTFATIGGMAKRFARVGLAVGVAGLGAGLALSARNAVKFSQGMAEVNTIAQVSQKELTVLGHQALQVARQLGQRVTPTVKGLYDTLSAGIPRENAIDFLRTSGKSAIAGVTDIDVAVDGLTSVINAYQAQASEAGHISDLMFNIVKEGKITFPELAENIGKVAPSAKAAGVSLETMSAAIATAVRIEKPERAMTAIRAAMFRAAKGGENFLSFVERFKGMDLKQIIGAGVAKRAAVGVAILAGNWELFTNQMKKAQNVAGMTEKAFQTMAATPAFQIKQLKSTFEVLTIQIGNAFLPLINRATQALLGMFAPLDTAEGQRSLIEFATTAALTATGFVANFAKGFNTAKAYIVGSAKMIGQMVSGIWNVTGAGLMVLLGAWALGWQKMINFAIAAKNKLTGSSTKKLSFGTAIMQQEAEMAKKGVKQMQAALSGDAMAEQLAVAMQKNVMIDEKRLTVENAITEQARLQTMAATEALFSKQQAAKAEAKATTEMQKQLTVSRTAMALRFAGALLAGSQEAYRATLPSGIGRERGEDEVAQNTDEANTHLLDIKHGIAALALPQPASI